MAVYALAILMLPRQASDPLGFCGVPAVSVALISTSLPSRSTTAHHIFVGPLRRLECIASATARHWAKSAAAFAWVTPIAAASSTAQMAPGLPRMNNPISAIHHFSCDTDHLPLHRTCLDNPPQRPPEKPPSSAARPRPVRTSPTGYQTQHFSFPRDDRQGCVDWRIQPILGER
jgi:hypothetical protein